MTSIIEQFSNESKSLCTPLKRKNDSQATDCKSFSENSANNTSDAPSAAKSFKSQKTAQQVGSLLEESPAKGPYSSQFKKVLRPSLFSNQARDNMMQKQQTQLIQIEAEKDLQ